MIIDELLISLGLKPDGVKEGMVQAQRDVKNGLDGMKSDLSSFLSDFNKGFAEGFAGKLAAGLAGVLGGAAITSLFNQYTATADALGKMADSLDLNIADLHAWSEAAARAGGSAEAFQATVKNLSGQLSRNAIMGTSRAGKLLEAQGIATVKDDGSAREVFDVLEELAGKAEEMSKAEFFGFAKSLGIDQGTIMLLQQGRDGLKDAVKLQKELGTYTKEDAEVTAYLNDRIADSKQALMALAAVVFRQVTPVFSALVEGVTKFVVYLRQHETAVKAFFGLIALMITAMVLPALAQMAAAILTNPIFQIAAVLAGIALVIEDLVVWAQGGNAALADFWAALFGSPEEAMKTWEDLKKGATEAWETVKTKATEAWSSVQELFGRIDWTALGQGAKEVWDDIKTGAEEVYAFVSPYIYSAAKTVTDAFETVFQFVSDHSDGILAILATLGNGLKDSLTAGIKILGVVVAGALTFIATAVEVIMGFIDLAVQGVDKLIKGAEWVAEKWQKTKDILGFGDEPLLTDYGQQLAEESKAKESPSPAVEALPDIDNDVFIDEEPEISVTWDGSAIDEAANALHGFWDDLKTGTAAAASSIESGLSSAWDSAKKIAGDFAAYATDAAGKAGAFISENAAAVVAFATNQAKAWFDFLASTLNRIMDIFNQLKAVFLDGLAAIGNAFSELAQRIISALGSAFQWVADKWAGVTSMFSGVNLSVGATAAEATAGGGSGYYSNSESQTEVSIGTVNVQTQATDANGIANDIGGALDNRLSSSYLANQGNVGVVT